MQLSHARPVVSATFDEPNLVSAAGLVPLMALAGKAGLRELADERLSVPTDKGANAGSKLSSLVAGMAAGADSINDMALLRHGGMGKIFTGAYAPSTLGSFLRSCTFGHIRQADAVASRFLLNLAEHTDLLGPHDAGGMEDAGTVMVDIDDTIIEVHGYQKQGAAFGYSGVRGLNALLATVSADQVAPVIAAQRLRKGSVGSPRGAARLATDTLALIRRSQLAGRDVLVRADSAFYSHALVVAALRARADVSITVRMDPAGQTAHPADHGGGAARRRRCVDHRADGPGGQTRHRGDRRGRVDHDQVHRRHLRPDHRQLDLQGPGRRDSLHRLHLKEEGRPGRWPAHRPPHPRAQPSAEHRAGGVVRHVALPRLLHHHRTR